MIPVPIASKIIEALNQLNQGLFEAAKWVEEQAYAGFEDEYALAGDRPSAPTDAAPVEEPVRESPPEAVPEAPVSKTSTPQVSLVQVRTALSDLSQAGKTAQVRDLIKSAGAEKLSEVDPGKYGWLLEQARGLNDA